MPNSVFYPGWDMLSDVHMVFVAFQIKKKVSLNLLYLPVVKSDLSLVLGQYECVVERQKRLSVLPNIYV